MDKRTDIWAFGCVLYQMLTGRRAFRGETGSDTMAAILEREPDWTALPAETPAAVRRLLQRCLEKDSRRRLRDIGDVRHWLDDVESRERRRRAPPSRGSEALPGCSEASRWRRPASRDGCSGPRPPEAPARNVQLQQLTDFVGMEESPAISPDGKTVAFVARAGGKRQIWVRLLAGGAPLQITRDDC